MRPTVGEEKHRPLYVYGKWTARQGKKALIPENMPIQSLKFGRNFLFFARFWNARRWSRVDTGIVPWSHSALVRGPNTMMETPKKWPIRLCSISCSVGSMAPSLKGFSFKFQTLPIFSESPPTEGGRPRSDRVLAKWPTSGNS